MSSLLSKGHHAFGWWKPTHPWQEPQDPGQFLSREAQHTLPQNVRSDGRSQENLADPPRANLYTWASSHEHD